ncbi:MAG: hypothetical protein ACYTG0_42060, partial [Planctomycetota bacterium]
VKRGQRELKLSATLGEPPADFWPRHVPEDAWGGGPFSERRFGFPLAMVHDMPVQPSDCGGPVVDTDGNVVGINIARALRVTNYAIPAAVSVRRFRSFEPPRRPRNPSRQARESRTSS